MKVHITISIDVDVLKKIKAKHVNLSKITEEAFKDYLNRPKGDLLPSNPEKSINQVWIGVKAAERRKTERVFSERNSGLVPNPEKAKHVQMLLKIHKELFRQTTINKSELIGDTKKEGK